MIRAGVFGTALAAFVLLSMLYLPAMEVGASGVIALLMGASGALVGVTLHLWLKEPRE